MILVKGLSGQKHSTAAQAARHASSTIGTRIRNSLAGLGLDNQFIFLNSATAVGRAVCMLIVIGAASGDDKCNGNLLARFQTAFMHRIVDERVGNFLSF